ncbi:Multidrug resistance protein [Diplodia seriata]
MGRGSLVSLHRQLLLRFDSVTQRSGVNTLGGEQLERLDDCSSRFRAWSEQIGVRNSALDVLEKHGSGYKNTIIRLFDGIYIRLRVVGNLMKEAETAGSDREDEARAAVVGIIKDMDSLEEQVADIQSFLERLSGHGSATDLQEPEQAYDSDDSQVRHVSNSTANTGTVSWTTTTDSTDHEPMAAPITPKARKTAKIPKTPQTQIISDKHTRSAPTSPGTASSVKTHNPEWEEEWDPEFVIAALSASESHASFTAPIDNENYADAKSNVNDNGIDDSLAATPAHRTDFSKSKSTSASSPPAAESTHLYHPANTTWMEDTSSNLKEGDSEEWTKAQTRLASKSTTSKSSPALRSDYERDYERFRKQVSSRMRLLEKLNRSLSRKIEELESGMAASEGDKRDVIEQYVKEKGGQEAWEKSIREAAVDAYKDSLRAEEYRELEYRKMLKHETRLIEKRAQREMSEIYQQSGLQVHEAALRHHDEVFQIQQRLTSELLSIERRIQEQIQAKLWSQLEAFIYNR